MYVVKQQGAVLSAVSLDSTQTSAAIACAGDVRIRWTIDFTHNSATAVQTKIYTSLDGGTTYGLVQSQQIASGTATLNDYTQENPVSGNETWDGYADILGATHVKLELTSTSGGANDLATVYASLVEQRR